MNHHAQQTLEDLKSHLRRASLAQIGGFRPPEDPRSSWFGRGVCLPDELLPSHNGRDMFPLLQINVSELPLVPAELSSTSLLVVFHNREEHPFYKAHGDGWLIRQYESLNDLAPLPKSSEPEVVRPFPIRWRLIEADAPGWEDAWDLVDLSSVKDDEEATQAFFHNYNRYPGTKVGGFPCEVQHSPRCQSETPSLLVRHRLEVVGNTVINPIPSRLNANCEWRWECQFY